MKAPHQYRWSSHNSYFGKAEFTWLERERILSYFGSDLPDALVKLEKFMEPGSVVADAVELQRAARTGVFASPAFIKAFIADIPQAYNRMAEVQVSIGDLLERVQEKFGVTLEQLASSEKGRNIVSARSVLSRCAQVHASLTLGDVSRALDKNNGSISYLAQKAANDLRLSATADEVLNSLT